MNNEEVAKILKNISILLEMQDVPFKPVAYERAAFTVESLDEDINEVKDLESLPGIGKNIAEKIRELLTTGKLDYYEKLKKKVPVKLEELTSIPGMGPKTILKIYRKLGVKTRKELEKAALDKKIQKIKGLGAKVEEKILSNLQFLKKEGSRMPLLEGLNISNEIIGLLKQNKAVTQISVAGSIRRMKETIGDVDILCTSKTPGKIMGLIKNLDFVKEVTAEGETKTSIRTNKGLQVDVRVVKPEEFGSALQYFTGNKEHNVKLRTYAIGKGFKLNEYGLFKGDKRVAGETEESIYKALGMQIMPPELREGGKEIEVALKHKIPEVVELSDIKGDMHVHSNWSDGTDSVKAMADYCRDKLKYSYVCLTDHAGGLKIAGALTSKEIIQRQKEISDLNSTYSHFKIVNGCETDIKPDGSLTLPDKELAKFDYVIAGVHTSFNMGLAGMTKRLVTALKNERVNAIAHPTGRILLGRKPYLFNEDEVFSAAAKYGKCLEINAFFNRLDLPDTLAMKAKIFGAKFCIGTDAHAVAHLNYMNLGVAVARRAWLTKNDIINTKNIF